MVFFLTNLDHPVNYEQIGIKPLSGWALENVL